MGFVIKVWRSVSWVVPSAAFTVPPLLFGEGPVVPSTVTYRLKRDQEFSGLAICVVLSLYSSFESHPSACFSIFRCSSRQVFGSHFHVNPMNFNGSDRAVTIGWLRKHGSLCSWPRLYCCQDSSRQLQFTILPWLHKTGLLQKPTLQKKKKILK